MSAIPLLSVLHAHVTGGMSASPPLVNGLFSLGGVAACGGMWLCHSSRRKPLTTAGVRILAKRMCQRG